MLGRSTLGHRPRYRSEVGLDPHYGQLVSMRFHHSKPPTILDVPVDMQWDGARHSRSGDAGRRARRGEPPVAGGCAVHLERFIGCPGRRLFQRAPVNADTILTSLEAGRPMQHPLMAHI